MVPSRSSRPRSRAAPRWIFLLLRRCGSAVLGCPVEKRERWLRRHPGKDPGSHQAWPQPGEWQTRRERTAATLAPVDNRPEPQGALVACDPHGRLGRYSSVPGLMRQAQVHTPDDPGWWGCWAASRSLLSRSERPRTHGADGACRGALPGPQRRRQ